MIRFSAQQQRNYLQQRRSIVRRNVRAGVPLFTDGAAQQYQMGYLDDPTSLLGSAVFLNPTLDGFVTPIVYENSRVIGVESTSVLVESSAGEIEFPLIAGSEFRFEHNEDIGLINVTGAIAGEAHVFYTQRVKDDSATPRDFDFFNIQVGGVQANVKFSDGAEPILTQEAQGYDALVWLVSGTNVVISATLNKGSDSGSTNPFDPNLVLRGTPVTRTRHGVSSLYTDVCAVTKKAKQATVPITVEGDAIINGLNSFGSTPDVVTSTNISNTGQNLSAFSSGITANESMLDTQYSASTSVGVLTIDALAGRMPDFLHDVDNLALAFINCPTDEGRKQSFSFMRTQENTGATREIDWDATTVNGAVVPVVWQDKTRQFLTQAADAVDTLLISVYDEYVEVRVGSNWG